MKRFITIFCTLIFLASFLEVSAQLKPVKQESIKKRAISPVILKKKETEESRRFTPDSSHPVIPIETVRGSGRSAPNTVPPAPMILSVPDKTGYNQGFRVSGTAKRQHQMTVYFTAKWKEGATQRSKADAPISFPVESDGRWSAKIERPYLSLPANAQDIRFEISAKQTDPNGKASPVTGLSVVRGTMAPPTISGSRGDVSMSTRTNPYGGGPIVSYAELYGKAIPNMNVKVSVATEYETPKQRYSSGGDNMRTDKFEGETVTVRADASGNWTIKRIVVPVPGNVHYGIYNPRLVITAVQSATAADVSAEATKKLDIKSF